MSSMLTEPTDSLVSAHVVAKWEKGYAAGSDKKYPSLEVVRLDQWYFKAPGRLLEYGFGCGENLLHLAERGHDIDALDACDGALRLVERKLAARPELRARVRLAKVTPQSTRLPYADGTFDYVTCLSVLSLLGTKARAQHLVDEFHRVLKPGGKLIIDVNGPSGEFAAGAGHAQVAEDTYEVRGPKGEDPFLTYCPKDEKRFLELLHRFHVDDVGWAGHRYWNREILEFIACARKR